MKNFKISRMLYWMAVVIFIGLFLILITGCAVNKTKEKICMVNLDENGEVIGAPILWQSETSQTLWFYYTSTKQVHKVTPFSELYVGELNSKPDPNSIEAIQPTLTDFIAFIKGL